MALTFTSVAQAGSTSNASSYATASITFTAGRLYVVQAMHSGTASLADASGVRTTTSAVNLTKVGGQGYNTAATPANNQSLWWFVPASTTTETLTITFPVAGTGAGWTVIEVTGQDLVTPIVSGSFKSATSDSGTSIAITPNALAQATNGVLAFAGVTLNSTAENPSGTGWSELGTGAGYNTPTNAVAAAGNLGGTATQVTFTGAGTGARVVSLVEIQAAATVVEDGDPVDGSLGSYLPWGVGPTFQTITAASLLALGAYGSGYVGGGYEDDTVVNAPRITVEEEYGFRQLRPGDPFQVPGGGGAAPVVQVTWLDEDHAWPVVRVPAASSAFARPAITGEGDVALTPPPQLGVDEEYGFRFVQQLPFTKRSGSGGSAAVAPTIAEEGESRPPLAVQTAWLAPRPAIAEEGDVAVTPITIDDSDGWRAPTLQPVVRPPVAAITHLEEIAYAQTPLNVDDGDTAPVVLVQAPWLTPRAAIADDSDALAILTIDDSDPAAPLLVQPAWLSPRPAVSEEGDVAVQPPVTIPVDEEYGFRHLRQLPFTKRSGSGGAVPATPLTVDDSDGWRTPVVQRPALPPVVAIDEEGDLAVTAAPPLGVDDSDSQPVFPTPVVEEHAFGAPWAVDQADLIGPALTPEVDPLPPLVVQRPWLTPRPAIAPDDEIARVTTMVDDGDTVPVLPPPAIVVHTLPVPSTLDETDELPIAATPLPVDDSDGWRAPVLQPVVVPPLMALDEEGDVAVAAPTPLPIDDSDPAQPLVVQRPWLVPSPALSEQGDLAVTAAPPLGVDDGDTLPVLLVQPPVLTPRPALAEDGDLAVTVVVTLTVDDSDGWRAPLVQAPVLVARPAIADDSDALAVLTVDEDGWQPPVPWSRASLQVVVAADEAFALPPQLNALDDEVPVLVVQRPWLTPRPALSEQGDVALKQCVADDDGSDRVRVELFVQKPWTYIPPPWWNYSWTDSIVFGVPPKHGPTMVARGTTATMVGPATTATMVGPGTTDTMVGPAQD